MEDYKVEGIFIFFYRDTLKSGDSFGELAFINKKNRTAYVIGFIFKKFKKKSKQYVLVI